MPDEITEWLSLFIDCFREKFESLTAEEKKAAPRTLGDFSEPCQILTIRAEEPSFQILICSHIANFKDKIIKTFGPYENRKLTDAVEKEFLTDDIVNKIGKKAIESFLINKLKVLQQYNPYLGGPRKSQINGKTRISHGITGTMPYTFGWLILGSVTEFKPEAVANDCIKSIRSMAKPPSPTHPPPEDRLVLEGFGTYIYPPIWIGEKPKLSFKEKIQGPFLWKYSSEKALITRYKRRPLIFNRDGYIAIGDKKREKAIELLNEIMGTMLILEIPTFIVRENDVGKCCFRERSSSQSWPLGGIRLGLHSLERKDIPERELDEKKLARIVTWAETLTSDDKMKTVLLLFLEAYTHFINSEYKQALVMGWVILEDIYIKDFWSQVVLRRTRGDNGREGKLGSWTVDAKLEALNISQMIRDDEYTKLMEIKDARNGAVHEGKEPSKEVVKKCIDLAYEVLSTYIGNFLKNSLKSFV